MTDTIALDEFEAAAPAEAAPLEGFEEAPTASLSDFVEDEKQPLRPLSNSQISSYLRCSMMNYWRYEKGIKSAPNTAMSLGVTIHAALEHNFKQKILTRRDLPVNQVTEYFREEWRKAVETTLFDPDEDTSPETIMDQGVELITKYQDEIAPTIQPKFIEQKFSVRLPGMMRDVIGYIDLIDIDDIIVDHKTSKADPKLDNLAKDFQLTLYKIAFRKRHGRNPGGLRYDYLVRKIRKGQLLTSITQVAVERTEAQEMMLVSAFSTVEKGLNLKLFFPNPTFFGCSAAGCGYWNMCMGKIIAGDRVDFIDEIYEMQRKAKRDLLEAGDVR